MTETTKSKPRNVSRRHILAGAAVAGASGLSGTGPAEARGRQRGSRETDSDILGPSARERKNDTFLRQAETARRYHREPLVEQNSNGDDSAYRDRRASFHKTLPHNAFGEVNREAYRSLLAALASGRDADFDRVPLARTQRRTRRLANPQAAFQFSTSGPDGMASRMPPPPAFASDETAGEMLEVAWKAHLRDVPFRRFPGHPDVDAALSDLNAWPSVAGAPAGGRHSLATVFRGETPGDLTGPYISQFLLKDIPYGVTILPQRYPSAAPGRDFMTDKDSWLAVQRGVDPRQPRATGPRYIHDGRSLAAYVHFDFSYQAYQSAALILLGLGTEYLDRGNPALSSLSEEGFSTFGGPDVLDLVARAANQALSAAWYQKWVCHRRLRPEVYGGRLHLQASGDRDYGLPSALAETEAFGRFKVAHGTWFLPQAYPEGSPTHPSYPAGHACMAGACVTILKAFFDEDAILPDPVEASDSGETLIPYTAASLSVGGELNKLANNISLGRDWAGVHYRSDGTEGLAVGEAIAINILRDRSTCYNEQFEGFSLTRFDGRRIRVIAGQEYTLG